MATYRFNTQTVKDLISQTGYSLAWLSSQLGNSGEWQDLENKIYDYINKNRKLPDEAKKYYTPEQFNSINQQLSTLVKTPQQYLDSKKGIDANSMSEDDAAAMVDALKSYGATTTRGITDNEMLSQIRDTLSSKFSNSAPYVRNPNQLELDTQDVFGVIKNNLSSSRLPQYLRATVDTMRPQFYSSVSEVSNKFEKQNKAIDLANNSLSPYGLSLSNVDLYKILSSPENDSETIANSIVNAKKESAVVNQLNKIVPNELAAIKDWENVAVGNAKSEVDEATPYLYQTLNSRGLLDTGSLSTALAKEYNNRVLGVKSKAAEMGLESKLGGISKSYENTLRSALESGASLTSAIETANKMNQMNRQYEQETAMAELKNKYDTEATNNYYRWLLANKSQTSKPSTLDYFLQYGLPTVTSALTGDPSKSLLSGWLANMGKTA